MSVGDYKYCKCKDPTKQAYEALRAVYRRGVVDGAAAVTYAVAAHPDADLVYAAALALCRELEIKLPPVDHVADFLSMIRDDENFKCVASEIIELERE